MFELNTALHCIEEPESDVVEIYQSAPLAVALNGSRPEKRTAYVCAVKKKAKLQVYVALASRHGQIAVYTRAGSTESLANSDDSVDEALHFATSLGFTLDLVNLDYSPALREVILKGFKIFNQPLPAAPPRRVKDAPYVSSTGSAATSASAPVADDGAEIAPPQPAPSAAASVAPTAVAVAAVVAAADAPAAMLAEAIKRSDHEAHVAKILAELRHDVQALEADRDALRAKVQEVAADRQKAAAALKMAQKEISRVTAEREKLSDAATALVAASTELAELREEVSRLTAQLDEANRCNRAFVEESRRRVEEEAAHRESLCALKKEAEAVAAERDALLARVEELSAREVSATTTMKDQKTEIRKLTAERDALSRSATALEESSQEVAALQEEIAAISQQRDEAVRRSAELEAEGRTRSEQEAGTAQAAAGLKREMEALRADNKTLSSRLEESSAALETAEAALKAAGAEAATIMAERGTAAQAAEGLETALSEMSALREEVTLLTRQRDDARRRSDEVAEQNLTLAQRARSAQEASDRALAERDATLGRVVALEAELAAARAQHREEEPGSPPAQPAALAEKEAEHPLSGFSGIQDRYHAYLDMSEPAEAAPLMAPLPELDSGFSGSYHDTLFPSFGGDDADPVLFLLQQGETAIEYGFPEDVVELHRSTNFANMAPEGKGQESCQGYICHVKEGGAVRVSLAILGKQSGKTWVYRPEADPADDRAVAATFAGAVSFAEQVGLMMEELKFRSEQQRSEYLANCPVLRRTGEGCKLKKSA